jgi:DNA polymerase III alpha subunit (gram-positive type)
MRMMAFDLETGGLTEDKSILTAYFVVFDEDFNILDEMDLRIKPDNGAPYIVTAQALQVNGINLVEHDKEAITMTEAKRKLYDFLKKNSDNGAIKLIPVGQNIYFDISFLNSQMLNANNWKHFVSYHVLDTAGIAVLFKIAGIIPKENKTRLTELVKLFNVTLDNAHTAKGDTFACVHVLKQMIAIVRRSNV